MNPDQLTPEQRQQIRVFILEKLGWKMIEGEIASRDGHLIAFKPDGSTGFAPDFLASLDHCHEAEKALITDWFLSISYQSILSKMNIIEPDTEKPELSCPIFASASQRAVGLFEMLGGVL